MLYDKRSYTGKKFNVQKYEFDYEYDSYLLNS